MIECDALKLIEEFIKKSSENSSSSSSTSSVASSSSNSPTPKSELESTRLSVTNHNHQTTMIEVTTTTTTTRATHSQASNTSSSISCNSYSSFVSQSSPLACVMTSRRDETTPEKSLPLMPDTPPESPRLKIISLPMSDPLTDCCSPSDIDSASTSRKPNRPYSYYVATNFHPFDLSLLSSLEENNKDLVVKCETKEQQQQQQQQPESKPEVRTKKQKNSGKKRLSVSLSDIKTNNNSSNNSQAASKSKSSTTSSYKALNLFKLSSNKKCKSNQIFETSCGGGGAGDVESTPCSPPHSPSDYSTMKANKTLLSISNRIKSSQTTRISRLNKFFRHLFRPTSSGGTDTTGFTDEELDRVGDEENNTSFKFSRLFSFRNSFATNRDFNRLKTSSGSRRCPSRLGSQRTVSVSTNGTTTTTGANLIVTDEQPSKLLLVLPQLNGSNFKCKLCCEKGLSDSVEEKLYSDIVERLRKLAALNSTTNSSSSSSTVSSSYTPTSNLSNAKTSMSSIVVDFMDIPFIDDDNDDTASGGGGSEDNTNNNLYSYSASCELNSSSSAVATTTTASKTQSVSNGGKRSSNAYEVVQFDLNKINELIKNLTEAKFDELVGEHVSKYESIWNKIAFLFELTNRTAQMIGKDTVLVDGGGGESLVSKLKEIAANYIHEKYCDWIYKHGGWIIQYRCLLREIMKEFIRDIEDHKQHQPKQQQQLPQ